jgi:hypothetical protein
VCFADLIVYKRLNTGIAMEGDKFVVPKSALPSKTMMAKMLAQNKFDRCQRKIVMPKPAVPWMQQIQFWNSHEVVQHMKGIIARNELRGLEELWQCLKQFNTPGVVGEVVKAEIIVQIYGKIVKSNDNATLEIPAVLQKPFFLFINHKI